MKRAILSFCILLSSCGSKPEELPIYGEIGIIPQPRSIMRTGGYFGLDRSAVITAKTDSEQRVAALFNEILLRSLGYTLAIESNVMSKSAIKFTEVAAEEIQEAYRLRIMPELIEITGSRAGMIYGMQSLVQLIQLDPGGEVRIPAAFIEDHPRFRYRGMHLDVARHFFDAEFVKKYIDLIARYKFNYFHWHLTDDQGWRIEINRYPRLTEIGSKRAETVVEKKYNPYVGDGVPISGFYTQPEIRDVVEFARQRNVTIIPEIDVPGHSSAALAAYPELGCDPKQSYRVKTTWGGFPDVLCPTEVTFEFLSEVFSEVTLLFPESPYIHIGGDEVQTDQWRQSTFVRELKQQLNLSSEIDVQRYFIRRVSEIIAAKGKKAIIWDDAFDESLDSDVVVMPWQGGDSGKRAANANFEVIMAPTEFTYFDHPQSNPEKEPLSLGTEVALETTYSFDPIPHGISGSAARRISGGQGCLWTEFIKTSEHLEYMAFPRSLALAEALWSGKDQKDFQDFYRRMANELGSLDAIGVNYRIPKPLGFGDRNLGPNERSIIALTPLTRDSKIFLTRDGSDPNTSSQLYRGPIILEPRQNSKIVLKAIVQSRNRLSSIFESTIEWR